MFISVDSWIPLADTFIENNIPDNRKKDILKGNIFFIKTQLIFDYIKTLEAYEKPFLLITASNDDHCMPYMTVPCKDENTKKMMDVFLENPKLIHWYCKNPCIEHCKITPLPLGPKWQWKTIRFFGEDKSEHIRIFEQYGNRPNDRFYNEEKPNLLYFNFSQTTNNPLYGPHKNVRHACKSSLKKRFEWTPSDTFENYIKSLGTFKFCVSPPGRGIDTHRTWEALLVGAIPIVMHTSLDSTLDDLPVVFVDSWDEITKEFLNDKYTELKTRNDYSFEKLYDFYWKEIISNNRDLISSNA